ncbi:MAG: glycosyltransferase [Bryobacterales bacterium]|nr:glycosyltransferase [Bryobacterales bacterium]
MNPGGTETWLAQVARRLDPARFELNFLVHAPGIYDEALREAGAVIVRSAGPHNPFAYAMSFATLVRRHGPYDVVHSHLHHFSGFVLALARRAGVSRRLAHSHSSDAGPARIGWRAGYLRLGRHWIRRHATMGFAVSERAARALFGGGWRDDPRWKLQPCGIDLAPFRSLPGRAEVRASLGLPPDAKIIGHVGRFVAVKNHAFLLDVAAEILRREPRSLFVFAGDGPLRPQIEAKARSLALPCRFLGNRPDVPAFLGACDLFVFPSKQEGLGLAVVEAQAAGLRCLASSSVPGEAIAVPGLVDRLPLDLAVPAWAEAAISALQHPEFDRDAALSAIARSPLAIESSVRALEEVYGC